MNTCSGITSHYSPVTQIILKLHHQTIVSFGLVSGSLGLVPVVKDHTLPLHTAQVHWQQGHQIPSVGMPVQLQHIGCRRRINPVGSHLTIGVQPETWIGNSGGWEIIEEGNSNG